VGSYLTLQKEIFNILSFSFLHHLIDIKSVLLTYELCFYRLYSGFLS
jgi:hypothetical protein